MSTSKPMTIKERFFHTIVFELGAVIISAVLMLQFSEVSNSVALAVGVLISLMAMVWNFIFNIGFDHIFTAPREQRKLGLRLFHTLSFETGLLIFTLPFVAYFLKLSIWNAFLIDIGMTIAIVFYTLIFNWCYDHLRLKFI